MSDVSRDTAFLASRLGGMGIAVEIDPSGASASGELQLGPQPFRTLEGNLRMQRAGFYTLGHGRLKFYTPRLLFDLPAIDVARCDSARQIEAALRRTFAETQRDLRAGREWLSKLGAAYRCGAKGTRLRFLPAGEAEAEVRSPRALQLPSGGPLAGVSLATPAARLLRPLPSLETAFDLETSLQEASAERAQRRVPKRAPVRTPSRAELSPERMRRIVTLSDDPSLLSRARFSGVWVDSVAASFSSVEEALDAFCRTSPDAVVIDLREAERGFELAVRLRELPGVDRLPIVFLDAREIEAHRVTAEEIGSSGYYGGALSGRAIGESLIHLLDHGGQRRYHRFTTRLPVCSSSPDGQWDDVAQQIARGGMGLRASREVAPGSVERYSVALPGTLGSVAIDGEIISLRNLPGYASMLAGIRFLRFEKGGERRWIELVEQLARRRRPQRS